MARYIWIILLLFCTSAFGQGRSNLAKLKFYDTTKAHLNRPHFKYKKPKVGVDSTSILMEFWQDSLGSPECTWHIDLQNTIMPLADYVTPFDTNGFPAVRMGNDKFEYCAYRREDGGFEWDAILKSKPAASWSKLTIPITSTGLRFLHQPPLSDSLIAAGHHRPDSVVNSYAVYHSTQANGWCKLAPNGDTLAVRHYGNGKAFHIFRPKMWDQSGDTIWVDMVIDTIESTLTLTMDKTWLKNAVYPVTIDPAVGYTSTPGSSAGDDTRYAFSTGSGLTYTASTGDELDSLAAYAQRHDGLGIDLQIAVFTVDGSGPDALFYADTFSYGTSASWQRAGGYGQALSNGVAYTTTIGCPHNTESNYKIWYDSDAGSVYEMTAASGCGDTWSGTKTKIYKFGGYLFYTTGGAPPAPSVRRRKVLLGEVECVMDSAIRLIPSAVKTKLPYTMSMFDEPIETEVTQ